jgi:hypothetical protein
MARNISTAGFRFVVEGVAPATASIKQIDRAAEKLEQTFLKNAVTGEKFGKSLVGAASSALPQIGLLQLGAVGVAASLADKMLPALTQTASHMAQSAIEAMGFGAELKAVSAELKELGENWDIARGAVANPLFSAHDVFKNAKANLEARKDIEAEITKEDEAAAARRQAVADARAQQAAKDLIASFKQRATVATKEENGIYQAAEADRVMRYEQTLAQQRGVLAVHLADVDRMEAEATERQMVHIRAQRDEVLAANQQVVREKMQQTQMMVQGINILNQATQAYVTAMVTGSKTSEQALSDMMLAIARQTIQLVLMEIQARAVAAAVNAFATSAGPAAVLGPAGVAIAAGTAAAFYGAAMGMQAQVPHLATGGLIMGGTPGRDSVPAMLQPGEFVIPARETALLQAMLGRRGGTGSTTIVINQAFPDSRATDRMIKEQLIPSQQRLARIGIRG